MFFKEYISFVGISWGESKVFLRVSYGLDNGIKGRDIIEFVGWRIWSFLEKRVNEGYSLRKRVFRDVSCMVCSDFLF